MRCTFRAWLLAVAALTVSAAQASDHLLIGSEQVVSAVTAGTSGKPADNFATRTPAIATDPEGLVSLIVWAADDASFRVDTGDDGDSLYLVDNEFEIFAAVRHAANDDVITNPFRVSVMGNDLETDAIERARFAARNPAVTWNPVTEEFLIVWEGDDDTAPLTNDEFEIFAQRVSRAGELIGSRLRVSEMGDESETDSPIRVRYGAFYPKVAVDENTGGYLVVWYGDDNTAPLVDDEFEIFGRRLDAEGQPLAAQFRISTMGDDSETVVTERRQYNAFEPDVSFNPASARFVVAWHGDDNQDTLVNDEFEIFAQQIDTTGALIGSRVRISNMGPDGDPTYGGFAPTLAVDPATGTTLLAWHGDTRVGALIEGEIEVFGRLVDVDTNFLGSTLRISVMGPDGASDPVERRRYRGESATAAWNPKEQEFLVAWHGDSSASPLVDDEIEVFGRLIRLDGSFNSNRIRISDEGDDKEEDAAERVRYKAEQPAVAYAAGAFSTVWSSGGDNRRQIHLRRLASQSTTLALGLVELDRRTKAPDPVSMTFTVTNTGNETAEDVRATITQTENFPITFVGCDSTPAENVCLLGDLAPEEKRSVEVLFATDHITLGDPQVTTIDLVVVSETALESNARIRTLDIMAGIKVEGGSGALDWLWFSLLLGLPLLVKRRCG